MYGIVPRRLGPCITRNINAVLLFQPTQNKGDQKGPTSLSRVTSTNIAISPKNFLTFSLSF